MLGLGFQQHRKPPLKLIISFLISFLFVLISQFSLTTIPHYFSSSSLLINLSLSALLLLLISGFSKLCKRILHVFASAPAFVFFTISFIWVVHFTVIRKGIPLLWSVVFDIECVLLMIGFFSILSSDPGFVTNGEDNKKGVVQYLHSIGEFYQPEVEDGFLTAESCLEHPANELEEHSFLLKRVRHCKFCKAHVKGFDHHCPAFGNCIGQKNHLLFMVLLVGFLVVESSYIVCSNLYIRTSLIANSGIVETGLSGNLAISTSLFSHLQVMWQVLFLAWHIYCVSVNIRTDEWINWKKYPEFQIPIQSEQGHSFMEKGFLNPYDKGIVGNIKELLSPKE